MTQTNKVLNFMRKNAYQEYNARTLSRILKINENKTKVYLSRLHNKGLILRTTKGFYKAVADMTVIRANQLSNPPTLLHGIMMECTLLRGVTKRPHGSPPKKEIVTYDASLIDWLKSHGFGFRDDNGSWFRYVWWEGRRVTVSFFGTGTVTVYVSCSSHPLDYPAFEMLLSFLDGFFEGVAPFKDRRVVRLKEVALAKDFKELRLDGVKSVSIRAFKNDWARIYYKDDLGAVRFEHHLNYVELSLDSALKSLSILTHPVNYVKELEGVGVRVDGKEDVT